MDICERNEEQCRIFCYNIRAFRRRYALTRKEMAALLHIDSCTLRSLERGKMTDRLPSEVFIHSARLFGVRVSEQFLRFL